MKVLLIDWNSYGNEYIKSVMERMGYEVCLCPFDVKKIGSEGVSQEKKLEEVIRSAKQKGIGFDYVFSFNYYPAISIICQDNDTIYISYVYDSPFMNIYSFTVTNSVNRIFVFDYSLYAEFAQGGINTVYYLPLAVDVTGIRKSIDKSAKNVLFTSQNESNKYSYTSDISFVGSLYTEKKHRLYDKFNSLPEYIKGYLDAIIQAQKNIYGENIIEGLLTEEIIAEMEKAYPTDPNPTTIMTPAQIYTQFVLERQVTSIERSEVLTLIGEKIGHNNNLYTNDSKVNIPGWRVNGPVDYYSQMPYIFNTSKINLNISLRSIKTGIPLRAFDIMGAGGFLLSNYQQELLEYFVPGEDLAIYEDYEDLLSKIEYYLSHEKEREQIAENGYKKVATEHTFEKRIELMETKI